MIPLYRDHGVPSGQGQTRDRRLVGAHPGLWFERFFNQYDDDYVVKETAKSEFLKGLKSLNGDDGVCGKTSALQQAWKQRKGLLEACSGEMLILRGTWHFVTGLGSPHPVENGLLFHPTLAVPYLPGSSVKGLVRAWIERQLPDAQPLLRQLFGSEDKDPGRAQADFIAGEIIFFDALPLKPVHLVVDTMTPHMGGWYEKGASSDANQPGNVPADWHDPIPVPFLAIRDLILAVSFAPRLQHAQTPTLMKIVHRALQDALTYAGAGAKTAAGYGGFTLLAPDDPEYAEVDKLEKTWQDAQAQQTLLATLSAEGRRVMDLRERSQQLHNQTPGSGSGFYSELLETLQEATHWPNAKDRADLVEVTAAFLPYVSKKRLKDFKAALRQLKETLGDHH